MAVAVAIGINEISLLFSRADHNSFGHLLLWFYFVPFGRNAIVSDFSTQVQTGF